MNERQRDSGGTEREREKGRSTHSQKKAKKKDRKTYGNLTIH